MNKLIKWIWQFAIAHNIWLSSTFIPGEKNVQAHFASHVLQIQLSDQYIQTLMNVSVRGLTFCF